MCRDPGGDPQLPGPVLYYVYCTVLYCTVLCAGTRVGTPNYQAPEMLRTHREEAPGYTMAADWWSYGVLVYKVSEDRCPGPAACWCADADRGPAVPRG